MPIKDFNQLLKNMDPKLSQTKYYFVLLDQSYLMNLANVVDYLICIFYEDEGLTVIFSEPILKDVAEVAKEPPVGPFAKITLNVNSDLMAVGFMAKITSELAKDNISVNPISAYKHDHIFVPFDKREKALSILYKLTK